MIIKLNASETQLVREAYFYDEQFAHIYTNQPARPNHLRDVIARILTYRNVELDVIPNPTVVMTHGHNGTEYYISTTSDDVIVNTNPKAVVAECPYMKAATHDIILSIDPEVLNYRLIKTHHRLTFDILSQHPATRYRGEDDGPYFRYKATNGYEIFSRSRMDIHTERVWLLGAKDNLRSGTIPYSDNAKRDRCAYEYHSALSEWIHLWKLGKLKSWA